MAQTTKPTTKPAGNQSRNIDFELDKLIGLGDLTFRNAAGAFWIGFRNVKFSSPRDEEVQGLLEYVPYYRSGTVSVVAIDFIDAGGKTIARAKVECPSRSGEIEVGFPVFAFMSVEFHAFYAFYQQIAKFRLSLIEEAKTQETNVPETE